MNWKLILCFLFCLPNGLFAQKNVIDSLYQKLDNEKVFLMRKIDEVQSEIFQLENNIQFFTNTRNAKKENSIVLEVRKNIEKHKEELVALKAKLKELRSIKTE